MSKEILMVVEVLSNEKDIPEAEIFDAMSEALVQATKKKYNLDYDYEVIINQKTGDYDTFRKREVIENDHPVDFLDTDFQIKLADANKIDPELEVGDYLKEEVASIEFGRIAAQAAKQVYG